MSYAQRHRSRLELHQSNLRNASTSADLSVLKKILTPKAVSAHGDQVTEGDPQRSNSSLLRVSATRIPQGHGTGIDIAAWSEAASNAIAGERQPFQLFQHTPPKNEPPRLKASRKQFASPQTSAMPSDANQSVPVSLPMVVNCDSLGAVVKHNVEEDNPHATDTRNEEPKPTAQATSATDSVARQLHIDAHSELLPESEMSPSPIPVSHRPSQPQLLQPRLADSPVASSACPSTSQWPVSETFTARLRNIMETRQQIEALVKKQREDEEEMVHAIASMDEHSQLHQTPQPLSTDSASAAGGTVSRRAYEQVLMERNAAFAALREFKEKGNAIVHHLYDTVKSQQEQSLELVATVEALKKANKRLKESISNSGGGGSRAGDSISATDPSTVVELQQKIIAQRRVIEQMDQLMQNADRMLLAMRARVEVAERRAASSATPLDRRQLPPLPKWGSNEGARITPAGDGAPAAVVSATSLAMPDAVAAIERLLERYTTDQDVATVATQQQLLLERIAQLQQALKQEKAQRLHLEEVYGATSEETARNVALLEERLQRAESPRVVSYDSGKNANNGSALRYELHTLLEEEGKGTDDAAQDHEREKRSQQLGAAQTPKDDDGQRSATHSHMSSRASSHSSTPSRTLFTAVSVGDVNTTTTADEVADGQVAKKLEPNTPAVAAPAAAVPEPANGVAATDTTMRHTPTTLSASPPSKDSSPPPRPQQVEDDKQPRVFLGQQQNQSTGNSDKRKGTVAAAPAAKPQLGIPVPAVATSRNSLQRFVNSRSSSTSHRLVDFRPADATSRGLDSMSDVEKEEEIMDVNATSGEAHERNGNGHNSGVTGVTSTVTPTAIHSASSPLPDTTTSAEMSAKRQQRLHQQKEELKKMEADATNMVRSLDMQ